MFFITQIICLIAWYIVPTLPLWLVFAPAILWLIIWLFSMVVIISANVRA